ncbi:hormogonium polysaccharide biosynthesis protein HpsL [Leptolyngbya sp. CCNP1308]|uniref:hormogonium polysaccharide biosynthesis protein HpsL n=1 Tax=Leptolyngbya sp. CCNP1308 TaxID=3110255 RepID=UPI002B202913|nr:hormogonium polysaccharide biosynthesis protein HpsL [Leptolyngbya sp. CCNP1308]MEA5450430.1 hormogonium polysaccharide biosynthesis protein HpsL [Leptolyngbya sp. CCNP1308]
MVDTPQTQAKASRPRRRKGKKDPADQAPPLSRKAERAKKRQAQKARKELIQYLSATLFVAGLIGVLLALLGEPKLAAAAIVAIACLALSFKYPRQAIYGLIIYVPFGGTVVYALGGSGILQLAKDAIYIPALIGVIQFCRRTRQPLIIPPLIKIPLLVLLGLSGLTLLVVNGGQQLDAAGGEVPILIGVLGLKVLIGYVLIIPCIYYLLRDREDVYFLLRLQVVLILVCCGLGFMQYMMLRLGICQGTIGEGEDLFKASLESRCLVGGSLLYAPSQGQIRLPGTFNAPWQWGWFLISSGFFAFGTAFSDRSPLWRIVGLGSLAAVGVMAVVSGQRIALALVPATIVGLLVLTGQVANLKRFLPIGIGLALILTVFMAQNPEVVNERWASFESRWSASPPHEFIVQQFQWAQKQQEGILGRGVGRATNAARIFGKTELVETYHPKLMYEIGPLGLLATLAVYLTLTIATFKAYRSIKDPNLRGYGASMWVFVLFISIFPYYYPLDVDPVNVYYWLAAGIVLKLPEIDQKERLQQRLEEASRRRKLTPREKKQLQKQETIVFE